MTCFIEISAQAKANRFDEAAHLLKANEAEVDSRLAFKLLRSLATQLNQKSNSENRGSLGAYLQGCCSILEQSKNPAYEETEFTQGVLSLYHLITRFISSGEAAETIILLSQTMLCCLKKFTKSAKDVESIAANSFVQVWNAANKVEGQLPHTYRIVALSILVHGGSNYWNRVMDKLVCVTQEPSTQALQLAESVFDELVFYCESHNCQSAAAASALLQAWMQVVNASNNALQYQKRTSTLKAMLQDLHEWNQVDWMMELVINVFGTNDAEFQVAAKWIKGPLSNELEVVLVRMVQLILSHSSNMISQLGESKRTQKHQVATVVSLLLLFSEKLDELSAAIEVQMQLDPLSLKSRCLTRAGSLCCHLLKMDPSRLTLTQTLFQQSDQLLKQGMKDQSKTITAFLSSIEVSAYNVGVVLYQQANYATAANFFRKALEYLITYHPLEFINGAGSATFLGWSTALYDCRKVPRDWMGVLDDFTVYATACYVMDEASGKVVCRSRVILQQFLLMWSRFKRDLHLTNSADRHLLDITVVDLLKRSNLILDPNSAWELLHDELQALDNRKGSMPKAALTSAVQQAAPLAKSTLQKGISQYFLSREGTDLAQRHAAAKSAVTKLTAQASPSPAQSQGRVYLALAYLELYVSQQELLKQKTEEEMASLGPLIQSSSNVEGPPGEDGTNVASDGTSVDAVSYSYLKLELELKNQDWMVKSLLLWEELVQFGWRLEHYSSMVFNALKSLGHYFNLFGNSYFSARAWTLLQQLAESTNSDDEYVLACSEQLKLGLTLDNDVMIRCKEAVEKKGLILQEQINFHLSLAWSRYHQQEFVECWEILQEKVLNSAALSNEAPSKSVLLLLSQASLLRSLLTIMPEELSHIPVSSGDCGPVQAGVKAAQTAYTAHKCYLSYAQQQQGWDYHGQEWNVLRQFLVSAVNLARIYLYTAAPREARFFLKEALNASQKHVSVLRTAEALLELCGIDLMLDNTMDCQSKLVLICHLMGMAPPVVPEPPSNSISAKKPSASPSSPVQIRSDRRKGYSSKAIPEVPIELQQDATHRSLLLPFNHQGASPKTRAREVVTDGGIFPDHGADCSCLTCSSELVASIRCAVLTVQAKLWSIMGFQDLASDEFLKGARFVRSMCSRLKSTPLKPALKTPAKRLFDVPAASRVSEVWMNHRIHWFQPSLIAGLELIFERAMHLSCIEDQSSCEAVGCLSELKSTLYEFCIGPLEHRVMKLVAAMNILCLQTSAVFAAEPPVAEIRIEEDDDVIILDSNGYPPKTPALAARKPLEMPPPRRIRRNLLNAKIEDTITIEDDDDDSDTTFSRRRLGKPQRQIVYSSDSDSDVMGPTPSPPPEETLEKTKRVTRKEKKDENDVKPKRKPVAPKAEEKTPLRSRLAGPSQSDGGPTLPEKRTGKGRAAPVATVEPTASSKKVGRGRPVPKPDSDDSDSASNKPTEKRFVRSKGTKAATEEVDLSSRLAKMEIEAVESSGKESRPKRVTRSKK